MSPKRVKKGVKTARGHDGETRLSPAGQVCCLSPSWYDITGFNPEDILKDPLLITRIIHPDDLHLFNAHLVESGEKHRSGKIEFRIIRPDGEVRWVGHSCVPVFDENNQYTGARGDNRDITERKNIEHIIAAQRDLGLALDKASSLQESLHLCLAAALRVSGLEAGGIYMLDQATGDLNLILSSGHADKFIKINNKFPKGSERARIVMAGEPFYLTSQEIRDIQVSDLLEEKMLSIAAIPFLDRGRVIGSLHVASRIYNEMPAHSRNALGTITRQIGAAIARAQAEQNLKISEEKYRALFENAVEGIFQTTPDGQILSVNPAMAGIFGYDSLSGFLHCVTNIKQIYANPDDRLSVLNEIERKGPVHKYEVPCIRKDGQEILVAMSARAHRDQDGHVISYYGFIEDITQPKKMEDDLRKSEERFRSLLKSSQDAILMMDPEGRVSYWNPAAKRMFGYESTEAVGRNLHELLAPKRYLETHRAAYAGYLLTGRGAAVGETIELHATRKDGSEITVALSLSAEWINGGWNAIGILRDITEQKEAESQREAALEALRKSEEQFRAMFEMASIGMAQADLETGRWLRVNQKMCEITGYSADEMLALRIPEITHPEDREQDWQAFQNVVSGKLPSYRIEKRYVRKDGSIVWVNVNMTVVRDSAGQPIRTIATIEDITGRKRTEAELERSRDFIENAEDACFEMDLFGNLTFCNESFLKMTGYTYAEYMALSRWDRHPTREEAKRVFKIYDDVYRTGVPAKSEEHKILHKDGTHVIAEVSISLVRGKLLNPVGFRGVGRDITKRKKAEEGLREAHRRLDEVIDYLPDATFVIDTEGKVIAWNRAMEQMTGIKAADMLGKGNYDYALPFYGERRPILIDLVLSPREDIEAKYVSTQRRDTVLEGEAYMPALRGGEVYLYGKAGALQDSKGNIVGAIESIRDITARRQAEEKYQNIFENAVEGVFQTTPDGRILSVNPAMVNLSGYNSPEDFIRNVNNIIQFYANPDDRLSFRKEIEEKGSVNKYEVLCVRKDGQKIWIAVNARAIRDQDGHINHYDGFFEDITERKKMGDDLRRSEERLRAIVDTSNAGIIMMTIDGYILFANQQMGKMLGCTVEELIGTDYNAYVHPEDCENVADNISRLQESNVNQLYTQRRYICRDSIERWGYVSIGRIEIGPGEYHVVLVISDITEFRKVENEKKLLEDYLRQAQKMEAIGTLAGGVAHDFNNILASMMGFTEMGIRETRQDIRRDYLEQVLQACERAKNLVNQILAFSRMREQERHPVNLRLILQEVVGLLRASLPATIEIKQDITQKETYVLADPTQIHQIVMNLCTNAAHAMREKGGVLAIHLGNIEIQHPTPVAPSDLPMGSYVQLSVRDTGHGIDDAVKDKIFDPFFTTKQAREGTGLGLSVVYGIVKSSGGSIKVQSTAGEGATFTIFLPRIRSENQSEETCQDDVDLRGHERILFVDDEEMLVKMAILFFEPLGYEITATTSSPEALRLFQENPGAFDLVITDMTMPQTTGIELSRALLKIRPELPIILCTGYSDSVNAAEARKLKIRELVLKPVSLTVLGRLVRQVLQS